jgi:hypothetical protein
MVILTYASDTCVKRDIPPPNIVTMHLGNKACGVLCWSLEAKCYHTTQVSGVTEKNNENHHPEYTAPGGFRSWLSQAHYCWRNPLDMNLEDSSYLVTLFRRVGDSTRQRIQLVNMFPKSGIRLSRSVYPTLFTEIKFNIVTCRSTAK